MIRQKERYTAMMTQTSPLQLNVEQAQVVGNANTQNASQGMNFRQMLPMLLINAVAPFAINMVAQHYVPAIDALLLASAVPAVYTLGSFLWKKHIDVFGLLVVVSLLLSAAFALVFKSPQLLLLQSSAISGLFGVVMLVSLLFSRPVIFYIARSITTQHDPQRVARFNADWSIPQIRSFYRLMTLVWGCITIAELVLHTVLVFHLPISTMLMLSPILSIAFIMPAAHWSMYILRKNRPVFAQLRKERDAA
jgi:intracellular septation protein A